MDRIAHSIKIVIQKASEAASLLILVIMGAIVYEVVSRYAFNAPTTWAWLVNKQLFGVFIMIAGGYTLIQKSHIRIEMLYDRFSPAAKACVRWLTLAAALCFLGSLLWKGTVMGLGALATREKATGVFPLPLYPLKVFIPLGAALFLLGCIAVYSRKD